MKLQRILVKNIEAFVFLEHHILRGIRVKLTAAYDTSRDSNCVHNFHKNNIAPEGKFARPEMTTVKFFLNN